MEKETEHLSDDCQAATDRSSTTSSVNCKFDACEIQECLDDMIGEITLQNSFVQQTVDDNVNNNNNDQLQTEVETLSEQEKSLTVESSVQSKSPTASLVPYRINDSSSSDSKDSESSSSSSTESSDSSSESSSDSESSEDGANVAKKPTGVKPRNKAIRTVGELGMEDLPPIQDLHITIPEAEKLQIGAVHAIIDRLVTVKTFLDTPPLDLDSYLFLNDGSCLGQIFDVFGPVDHPSYAVRFNSLSDIAARGISVGDGVFCAPQRRDLTAYIFVDELRNQRGSDASWKNNNEPPEEFLDYSDDEEEKRARVRMKIKRGSVAENSPAGKPEMPPVNPMAQAKGKPNKRKPRQNMSMPQGSLLGSPASFHPAGAYPSPFNAHKFAGPFQGNKNWSSPSYVRRGNSLPDFRRGSPRPRFQPPFDAVSQFNHFNSTRGSPFYWQPTPRQYFGPRPPPPLYQQGMGLLPVPLLMGPPPPPPPPSPRSFRPHNFTR